MHVTQHAMFNALPMSFAISSVAARITLAERESMKVGRRFSARGDNVYMILFRVFKTKDADMYS